MDTTQQKKDVRRNDTKFPLEDSGNSKIQRSIDVAVYAMSRHATNLTPAKMQRALSVLLSIYALPSAAL